MAGWVTTSESHCFALFTIAPFFFWNAGCGSHLASGFLLKAARLRRNFSYYKISKSLLRNVNNSLSPPLPNFPYKRLLPPALCRFSTYLLSPDSCTPKSCRPPRLLQTEAIRQHQSRPGAGRLGRGRRRGLGNRVASERARRRRIRCRRIRSQSAVQGGLRRGAEDRGGAD